MAFPSRLGELGSQSSRVKKITYVHSKCRLGTQKSRGRSSTKRKSPILDSNAQCCQFWTVNRRSGLNNVRITKVMRIQAFLVKTVKSPAFTTQIVRLGLRRKPQGSRGAKRHMNVKAQRRTQTMDATATSSGNTQPKEVPPLHAYVKKYCRTCSDMEYCNANQTRRLICVLSALVRSLEE